MTGDVPDTAITAAAEVLTRSMCADEFLSDREITRRMMASAAPVIAAQAAAAEREAIAEMADELEAVVPQAIHAGVVESWHPFGDLIRARTTP